VSGCLFDVQQRFELVKRLGEGSYGVVVAARDRETGKRCAIKKVKDAIEDCHDGIRTLRELRLLRHFRDHENCIQVRNVIFSPDAPQGFRDIYIVTELMDTDLHRIIRSPQDLSDDHVRYFVYQVIRGLKFLHSANVLHRDLKPNNLLVNANCDLKICDLGLARMSDNAEQPNLMTCYVVTRWYRAPELLLGNKKYTASIDMWSVGTILAELLSRKPLLPGKNYVEMLQMINSYIGTPTRDDVPFASEKAMRFIDTLPRTSPRDWKTVFPKANPLAIDLLSKLLVWNPEKRLSAAECLAHPYMAELHDPDDEPICESVFDFSFEKKGLSLADLRQLVHEEGLYYRSIK